jgi:hypothetical protein
MEKKSVELNRRRILQASVGASAAAALASTAPDSAQAYAPGGDETKARYRETEHVKAFYRTNGYETKNKT